MTFWATEVGICCCAGAIAVSTTRGVSQSGRRTSIKRTPLIQLVFWSSMVLFLWILPLLPYMTIHMGGVGTPEREKIFVRAAYPPPWSERSCRVVGGEKLHATSGRP